MHEELETLVRDGGFTPAEVLRMATRNAAEFLGDSIGGWIRVGARADLLLVEGDPLTNLRALRRPVGVMTAGRWLDRAALDSALHRVERSGR